MLELGKRGPPAMITGSSSCCVKRCTPPLLARPLRQPGAGGAHPAAILATTGVQTHFRIFLNLALTAGTAALLVIALFAQTQTAEAQVQESSPQRPKIGLALS